MLLSKGAYIRQFIQQYGCHVLKMIQVCAFFSFRGPSDMALRMVFLSSVVPC